MINMFKYIVKKVSNPRKQKKDFSEEMNNCEKDKWKYYKKKKQTQCRNEEFTQRA